MTECVNLTDIIGARVFYPEPISEGERRSFLDAVDSEMRRLGWDELNKRTADSERLTGEDYQTYVNY
ncbi:MAG: hypothetical protein AABY10_02980 [Nanoarchaeota archaeon]